MKKFISFIIIVFLSLQAMACPFCGCGVGNFYLGLLPNFKNHFIGLRYQFMQYHTQLKDDHSQYSTDYYRTTELWSGWSIGKKWQVLTFIPYHINMQNTDDGIKRQNGIGDITLLANYHLLQKSKINIHKRSSVSHDLWLSGGVKLPTGKYSVDLTNPDTELGDVNSQMGTGSTDFLANATYNLRINKVGINTSLGYKINTTNSDHFYYGNRFTANSFAYYGIRAGSFSIAPNAGVLYEDAGGNKVNNTKVASTGGYAALAETGAEFGYKKINIGGNVQLPFAQNFAEGQTTARARGLVHVTFSF